MIREYQTIRAITGPLVIVSSVEDVALGEVGELELPGGELRRCKVLELNGGDALVQLFEPPARLNLSASRVRFLGRPLRLGVSEDMLGRIFGGMGRPIDGGPPILPERLLDMNGRPTNPVARMLPSEPILTGISAIDGLCTLVRGQKLAIFSGSGLPHMQLVSQLVRQAHMPDSSSDFVVCIAAIGLPFEDVEALTQELRRNSAIDRTVMFVNLVSDPVVERLAVPRMCLTAAEYFAFERNMHVLTIFADMSSYADAVRELSSARREPLGRRGYPVSMRSDLASLFERVGCRRGSSGSITLLPLLTMSGDDGSHPILDLVGSVSEGQIVLSRELLSRGIIPPIDVLHSQSRFVRSSSSSDALIAALAAGADARTHAARLGASTLSATEQRYAEFADRFEREFVAQSAARSIDETLELERLLLDALELVE